MSEYAHIFHIRKYENKVFTLIAGFRADKIMNSLINCLAHLLSNNFS